MALDWDSLEEQNDCSVDPHGWGVPHNTERNRIANSQLSDQALDARINSRNSAGLPTWQLREEKARRLRARSYPDW
jgi:hypothetical protein